MKVSDATIGMRVIFGSRNGEKTLGIIKKINLKSFAVETLEDRGSRSTAGAVWRVHPSGCSPERATKKATTKTQVKQVDDPFTAFAHVIAEAAKEEGYLRCTPQRLRKEYAEYFNIVCEEASDLMKGE